MALSPAAAPAREYRITVTPREVHVGDRVQFRISPTPPRGTSYLSWGVITPAGLPDFYAFRSGKKRRSWKRSFDYPARYDINVQFTLRGRRPSIDRHRMVRRRLLVRPRAKDPLQYCKPVSVTPAVADLIASTTPCDDARQAVRTWLFDGAEESLVPFPWSWGVFSNATARLRFVDDADGFIRFIYSSGGGEDR